MMTSIAGGLNTGIWLCAVVLGATGSAIDVYKRQYFNISSLI